MKRAGRPSRWRWVPLVAAAIALGACSSADPTGTTDSPADVTASPEPIGQSTESPLASDAEEPLESLGSPTFTPSDGPLLRACSNDANTNALHLRLSQVDLATGAVEEVFVADVADSNTSFHPCDDSYHLAGWTGERLFDPGFQRLALAWQRDGHRIGWVNAENERVDVTDRLADVVGDLGSPQFDAAGNFVYVDYGDATLRRVDPVTLEPVADPAPVDVVSTVDQILLLPDDTPGNRRNVGSVSTDRSLTVTTPSGWDFTSKPLVQASDLVGDDGVVVNEMDWEARKYLRVVRSDGTNEVLLETGRILWNVVSGGDGSQLVVYIDGGEIYDTDDPAGLYLLPIGGGEPVWAGAELNPDDKLYAWPDAR